MTTGGYAGPRSEFRVNSTSAGVQSGLSFAALADGGFVASWTDASGLADDGSGTAIRAQRYDASGVAVGGELLVNTQTAGNQDRPILTGLASGGWLVTWNDASGAGGDADRGAVKGQLYDAGGAKAGTEFLVNTTTSGSQANASTTALQSGGFVVSWVDASGTAPDAKGTGIRAQVYSAGGAKLGGEFLVNTQTAGSQQNPALTSLASGGFVATWLDNSGLGGDATASIKAQIFSGTGAKVGTEFLVNTVVAGTQDQPAIASLAGGGFAVVWRDFSGVGDTSASGLKGQVFSGSGARTGGEFRVNTTTFNTQDQPAIVGTADGGFAVTWRDNSNIAADASGFGIKTQLFDAAGAKIGIEFQTNDVTGGNQEQPTITALASGALVIGWTDYSGTGGDTDGAIKARILVPTTAPISDIDISRNVIAETTVENSIVATFSSTAALNADVSYRLIDDSTGGAFAIDGNKLIVEDSLALDYESQPVVTIIVRATDTFGNSYDEAFSLALSDAVNEFRYSGGREFVANSTILSNQLAPVVTLLADGRSVVTWTDGSGTGGDASEFGIKGQILAADGTRLGGEFRVNSQTLGKQDASSVIGLSSGGFVVSWVDSNAASDGSLSSIKMQLFDAAGAPAGGEQLVNTIAAKAQTAPSLGALSTGGFVVTWTDASLLGGDASATGVKAQIFDAAGNRTGGEFLVNTNTANAQDSAVVTGLASGNFVVAWHDTSLLGGDASRDAVKAQIFSGAGSRIGGEFLVNTETLAYQQQPTIASLSTGGFVVAWADNSGRGGDADYYGIRLQVFDAAGAKVGAETVANTTTLAGQLAPDITALANGKFVVSWADYSGVGAEIGTAGIKAQVFADDGSPVGSEFLVDAQTLGSQVAPTISGTANGGFLVAWTDYGGQGGDDLGTGIKARLFNPLASQGAPPVLIANADTVLATEDQPVTIAAATLLANDTDSNNAAFAITGVAALSGGTAELDQNGDVLFTPVADFSGRAVFTYTIADINGETAIGRVGVQVANVNDAPIAFADAVSIGEDGGNLATAALLANDRDVDPGDSLRVLSVSATTALGNALALNGANIAVTTNAAYQALRAGETIVDSFDYVAADLAGATATATVKLTITGLNDAPTALALSNARIDENASAGTVLGTLSASDPDHDEILTYALLNNAGGRFAVDAATGIVTVAGGAPLDYETATAHTIVAQVKDAGGLTMEASFVVQLNNLPEPRAYTGTNGANTFVAPTNDLWTIHGLGGNDVLTGNASADIIYGDANNDILDGAGGADTLYGGIGADTFYVDDPADKVIEYAGEGNDLIFASVNFTMDANIENLTMLGSAGLRATGNDYANIITGNAGDNVMFGGPGGDFLIGNDGADTLWGESGGDYFQGGNGADTLIGGSGSDELIGGAGADLFVFDAPYTSVERDTVKDFTPGEDRFALSAAGFAGLGPVGALDPGAFALGTAATTADQHIIYNRVTGALYYDADGSGAAAMVQIALLGPKPLLGAADFIVV